jgi:hypothetical protein
MKLYFDFSSLKKPRLGYGVGVISFFKRCYESSLTERLCHNSFWKIVSTELILSIQ